LDRFLDGLDHLLTKTLRSGHFLIDMTTGRQKYRGNSAVTASALRSAAR
jgi:hypothetical protein